MENFRIASMKTAARTALKGKWGGSIFTSFVFCLLFCAILLTQHIEIALYVGLILLFGQLLSVGLLYQFQDLVCTGKTPSAAGLFKPFRQYGRILGASLLVLLYTLLWSLLLIVPGIIKSFAYSQTLLILRDHPEMSIRQAVDESQRIMHGYKMTYFKLSLSFIGWALLVVAGAALIFTFWTFASTLAGTNPIPAGGTNPSFLYTAITSLLFSLPYCLLFPYLYTALIVFYERLKTQSISATETTGD